MPYSRRMTNNKQQIRRKRTALTDDRWVNRFDRKLDAVLRVKLFMMALDDERKEAEHDAEFLRSVGIDAATEDLRAAIRDAVRSGEIRSGFNLSECDAQWG